MKCNGISRKRKGFVALRLIIRNGKHYEVYNPKGKKGVFALKNFIFRLFVDFTKNARVFTWLRHCPKYAPGIRNFY